MGAHRSSGGEEVKAAPCLTTSDSCHVTKKARPSTARFLPPLTLPLPSVRWALSPTLPPRKLRSAPATREHSRFTRFARGGSSRRPVDEAIFCALRMDREANVLLRLRECGLDALMEAFRTLCSSLSLRNVRVEEFVFLCAAVLKCEVHPRDCEVVFAFLRAERLSTGGISVAHLLQRLRTLFEPLEVLCALQLKCLLETHRLDHCNVSLQEVETAKDGLCSLIMDDKLNREVAAQWEQVNSELQRLHTDFAVPVPTFRFLVRCCGCALSSAVRTLGWDGKIQRPFWPEEDEAVDDEGVLKPFRAFDAGRLATCTVEELCTETGVQDKNAALLSVIAKMYYRRVDARGKAPVAAEKLESTQRSPVRDTNCLSAWRSRSSPADPTHPRFTADLYAVFPTSPSQSVPKMAA
ncbi:hypothetical protein JKF63_06786 [Porcisia hertigi]|uniref:Uncharacterized protein n=1 Tax=Porcisia hertigi TaxID=2761500 RepID=A0A836IPJ5_9TRYP|nr:hypothetical protein JKF63_06786 [Porcisia hertigi]